MSTVAAIRLRAPSNDQAPGLAFHATEKLLPTEVLHRLLDDEHPIRVWREHRGLSLADVGERTGLPLSYLAAVENGHCEADPWALHRLAGVLMVPAEELLA